MTDIAMRSFVGNHSTTGVEKMADTTTDKLHDWRRGVNQFSNAVDDAYEFRCLACGKSAYLDTGRRGAERIPLPTGPCPVAR